LKPGARATSIEGALVRWVLIAAVPPYILLLLAVFRLDFSWAAICLVGLTLLVHISLVAYYGQARVAGHLRTLANLLEAIVNGDYSLRGKRQSSDDPLQLSPRQPSARQSPARQEGALSELVSQINALADTLALQRLEARESQLLLGKVIDNIDIAMVAVDNNDRITLVNRAFCQLLDASRERLLASTVDQWQLQPLLATGPEQPVDWQFPRKDGRFSVYRDQFIENGKPHRFFLIRDVRLMLRSEEQQAWKKLIRVIGHEINNSLTPISSLSATLQKMVDKPERSDALKQGLAVIHQRAAGLITLVGGYRELAKQPSPKLKPLCLLSVLDSIRALCAEYPLELHPPVSPCRVNADRAQLEQVLINLVKNAHEAQLLAAVNGPAHLPDPIVITLSQEQGRVLVTIADHGTGISNPANLFVPFYTTKPTGSGIGLAVSRQIVESHGGELSLSNRKDGRGCIARVTLPALDES